MQQFVRKWTARMISVLLILFMLPCFAMAAPNDENSVESNSTESPSKLMAFSYDDGPSEATEALLDGLKERDSHVTFFMTGLLDTQYGKYGIEHFANLADRMIREGHQLGNHSYYHIDMDESTPAEIKLQVVNVEKLLFERMGGEYRDMFRPPHGECTTEIRRVLNMPIILWNVDSFDWKYIDADVVYRNIVNNASDGTVVDLHDLSPTSVEGSLRAIDTLKKKGYEFVTVAELMRRRGVTPQNGVDYHSFPNKGVNLPALAAPEIKVEKDHENRLVSAVCSTSEQGITLYYTTDGTYPLLSSPKYEKPIKVTEDTDLIVVGYDEFASRTPMARQTVKRYAVEPPEAETEEGKITLTCATPGAEIYYTLDGSEPDENSKHYRKPFRPKGRQLRAVGVLKDVPSGGIADYTVAGKGILFTDLDPEAAYFDNVCTAVEKGYMNGRENQTFEPDRTVTRAMLLETLYGMADSPETESASSKAAVSGYQDVTSGDSYRDAVCWALSEDISAADSAEAFGAANEITRQELADILYRYEKNFREADMETNAADLSEYGDGNAVSASSIEAVKWAAGNGILPDSGSKGMLRPDALLTRADLAGVLVALDAFEPDPSLLQRIADWFAGLFS